MKPALLLLSGLLISSLSCFAQADSGSRLRIAGTTCGIKAPAGFAASKAFSGFQHEQTGAFIMLNELPAPFKQVTEGFSEAAMKGKGMNLISTEQTSVRDAPATLFTVSQQSGGKTITKFLLVFAQGRGTALVTAGFPQGGGEDAAALKSAILGIRCDTGLAADPLEAAPFTMNTGGTAFKPVKFSGGSLLYSTDGKVPTEKPVLIAGSSIGKAEISTRKAFAEKRLKQLPGAQKTTIRESSEVTIDGLAGYEVIADGSGRDGNAALVYEVMLFTEDGRYFVIVGQAKENTPALLQSYRNIARSFKRK